MKKFIPYDKLSKKAKRELDARRRGSWGGLSPVTRKPPNPKAYDRNKAKRRKYDDSDSSPCSFLYRRQDWTNATNARISGRVLNRAVYMKRPICGRFTSGISSCMTMSAP